MTTKKRIQYIVFDGHREIRVERGLVIDEVPLPQTCRCSGHNFDRATRKKDIDNHILDVEQYVAFLKELRSTMIMSEKTADAEVEN